MKNRKEYEKTLKDIQDMASNIRTLNEAVRFGDDYDEDYETDRNERINRTCL